MKKLLVIGLMAAMLTGLAGCGDKTQAEPEEAVSTDYTVTSEDSDKPEDNKPVKSGIHYEEYVEGIDYNDVHKVQSYSEIPEDVREEMKAMAEVKMKEYIEENSGNYENLGELTYEGWAFQLHTYQSDPDQNYVYYFWSTTGTKIDPYTGEKKSGALGFYGRLDNVIQVDEHTFTSGDKHGCYFPSANYEIEFDHSQLLTAGYLEEVDLRIAGVTAEAGDGFEKYGEYKAPQSVAQVEQDPLFEQIKKQGISNIDYYMDENFEENIHHTEPEYFGFYITSRDDIKENGGISMIYKAVISDTEGLCEDTEVLFNVPFYGVRFTESGALMYGSSSREMIGKMFLGDSAYTIRAFPNLEDLADFCLKEKDGSSILVDKTDSLNQ